jgi:WD40 repeat protein
MVELAQHARLAQKPRDRPFGPDDRRSNCLERDDGPVRLSTRTVHDSHSPLTEHLLDDVVWDREGRWIASGGLSRINFWDMKTGQRISTIDYLARCLAISPDGRRIAATNISPDPVVNVWDVKTKKIVVSLKGKKDIAVVDFSPDGKRLVTVGKWDVVLWDAMTGRQLLELGGLGKQDAPNPAMAAMGARFSPDGRRIASVTGEVLRIWSIPAKVASTESGLDSARAIEAPAGARTKRAVDPITETPNPG